MREVYLKIHHAGSATPLDSSSGRAQAAEPLRGRMSEFAVVLVTAFLLLAALATRTTLLTYQNPNFSQPWDHHKYIHMAQGNPFDFHIAPFCWRVLTPLLAKILPFNLEQNFFIITFLSIMLTGVIVYYLIRQLGFAQPLAYVGMLFFFALGLPTKGTLTDFWLSDPLAMLLMTAAILCIFTRKDLLFLLLVTLGEGARESVILVVPLYYTLNAQRLVDLRLAFKTVLFALPPLAVFVGLRTFIPEMNNNAAYLRTLTPQLRIEQLGSSSWNEHALLLRLIHHPISQARQSLSAVSNLIRNCLVLLPFLPFVRNRMLALRFAPYAVLLYLQTVMIDPTPRYFLPLYPVLVMLAADGIGALSERFRIPIPYFGALPLLFIALNLRSISNKDASGSLQIVALVLSLLLIYAAGVIGSRRGIWQRSANS